MTPPPASQLPADRNLRVHLGCGDKYIPGFVHVDAIAAPHVDIVAPVETLPYFTSNSVELIYASHVLEHFGRHEFENVLKDWYRVLKPSGMLRLAVPDFQVCARRYLESGEIAGDGGILGLICGGQNNQYDFHKMIFDRPFLESVLRRVGFTDCRAWDWRTNEHHAIDDYSQAYLPHMDKTHGQLMSLNIEAIK